jgi:hypothetical protein
MLAPHIEATHNYTPQADGKIVFDEFYITGI